MPQTIHSDNATNFVGVDRKLRELKEAFLSQSPEVMEFAAEEGFKFAFIPPRAPHFGGLWEAAVKSAKHLAVRAMGNVLLTAEDLGTLLAEVEAILNSRPLAPLSQDPNDHGHKCQRTQFAIARDGNFLQEHNKWLHPKRNLQPGDLVLIHEDNTPPQQWALGRIAATVEGRDGKVRVADVVTKAGTIKRPIHKLALLPIEVEGS
ncbi:uncharacterized protein LOC120767828 [Bactrocera tryoni]|uniref:uncharacterized protein LOC120767828 n=1 Tax=Bactrocera tryoni TaxID=59916 RepID=UPI001A976CCC|nr:uncharacterized protein LOC120767828 [Bactrocera tryoni]